MPITWMPKSEPVTTFETGSGSARSSGGMRPLAFFFGALPAAFVLGVTVRNDGQKPLTQEKSLLHEVCWMRVLRPNSVSTGSTLMQFDFTPQSPQPSHTRSLMTTLLAGSGALPRLRERRNSAAHSWSWISTVVPGIAARLRCASSRRSRCQTSVPAASLTAV